jgi:hypothetical protein
MPISTTSTFTCDRDGTVSEPVVIDAAAVISPPQGWARLLVDTVPGGSDASMKSVTGFLCPACVEAFNTWLGKSLTAP